MYKLITLVLLLFTLSIANAQEADQDASPPKGVNALALEFYRIDFTKGQRVELEGQELELIFIISESGKASLEEVNGLKNAVIIDSLKTCTNRLEGFNPKVENGSPVESLYFLQLVYPTYEVANPQSGHACRITFLLLH